MSIIWQNAPECGPDKLFWNLFRDSLAKLSVWVCWLLDFVIQHCNGFWWIWNCVLLPCCSLCWLSSYGTVVVVFVVDLLISSYVREVWQQFLNWVEFYAQVFCCIQPPKQVFEKFLCSALGHLNWQKNSWKSCREKALYSFFKLWFVWRLCHVWCIHQNMVVASFQIEKRGFQNEHTHSKMFRTI